MPKKKFSNLIWEKKDIKKFFNSATIKMLVFTFESSSSGPFKIEVAGFDSGWHLVASDKLKKKSGSSDIDLENDFVGSVYILEASAFPPDIQQGNADLYFTPVQYKDKAGNTMPFVTWIIKDTSGTPLFSKSINPKPPAQ